MSKKGPIIIVEDDPDDQLILQEVLEDLQTEREFIFLNDCDSAYNLLMSMTEKPFVILCDINMPKMNGVELKQKIDSTDHLRKRAIPFVFLTTSDDQTTIDDAYRITNLQGYFKKGTSMNEIKKRVKCILEYWEEALHPKES